MTHDISSSGIGSDTTRPDVHNSEVDESAASRQLCGMTHLGTGRVCLRPERHVGGCDFVHPPKPTPTV